MSEANVVAALAAKIDALMLLATSRSVPDRTTRLRDLVTEDIQFVNPGVLASGIYELAEVFEMLSESLPSNTEIRRISTLDSHHNHFRYAWERREDGSVVANGLDLGWASMDGRVAKIVTFDGKDVLLLPTR